MAPKGVSGVSVETIKIIEKRNHIPKHDTILKLAGAYGYNQPDEIADLSRLAKEQKYWLTHQESGSGIEDGENNRTEPSPPAPDTVERPAPLSLHEILGMSRQERLNHLERWKQVKAEYPTLPPGRAASVDRQRNLQKSHAIDFRPLNELLDFLKLKQWSLRIPLEDGSYKGIKRAKDAVCEAIHKGVTAHSSTNRPRQLRRLLDAVYDYLAEEDQVEKPVDLAFVPGYRATFRADKAAELFFEDKCTKILLSGSVPHYETGNSKTIVPLTEACALAIYLVEERYQGTIHWDDLIVEERARDTWENVQFSARVLRDLSSKNQKPVSLVIVSSPFHLRRAYLEWARFRKEHPELVGEVKRVACSARYVKGNWFKHLDGVKAYVGDFWKLHGGRVIGQF